MKFFKPIPVKEIAKEINAQLMGLENLMVQGINEIHKVEKGDITFSDNDKYYARSLNSAATIVILDKAVNPPVGKAILVSDNPFEAYNSLVLKHRPVVPLTSTVAPTAKIHPSAIIEPNVIIGHHAEIGANSYIQAGVYIGEYTIIGQNTTIQAGAIIGSDAFYYKRTKTKLKKWRSGGRVVIGADVEIGAGCTVNKGVSGDTVIGDGTKLDCLIHIGHGAVIGKHCLMAAQVGVGGKTIIGDHVVLYGQVGVAQNLVIGDHVTVMAKSGVSKDIESGKTYFGIPADDARTKYRELATIKDLPAIVSQMKSISNEK